MPSFIKKHLWNFFWAAFFFLFWGVADINGVTSDQLIKYIVPEPTIIAWTDIAMQYLWEILNFIILHINYIFFCLAVYFLVLVRIDEADRNFSKISNSMNNIQDSLSSLNTIKAELENAKEKLKEIERDSKTRELRVKKIQSMTREKLSKWRRDADVTRQIPKP